MVQKGSMHCLPNHIIAPERKGYVTYPSTNKTSGKIFLDPAYCFDIINSIVVMLFYSCRDCQNIRIKYYIMRRKTDFFCQNVIRSFTDLNSSFVTIRLPFLVKSHYNDSSSIFSNLPGHLLELLFPFFQAN